MKKRLLPIFIILAMLFTLIPPLPASAQAGINPFENMDNLRTQAIELSNKSANNTDKTTMEQQAIQAQSDDEIFSNQNQCYIIRFLSNVSLDKVYDCVSNFKYKLLSDSSQRIFKVEISDLKLFKNTYSSIIQNLEKPVLRKVDSVTPNDEKFSNQWALPDINIPEAWDITKGSSTIKVGVIDSGLYRSHEDLQGPNFLNGYDFYNNMANVTSDAVGHGTMVSSVIAASVNNSKGIAGACWNVSIMPYKVADPSGNIYSDEVISAIMMAADNGCDVINLSLGSYEIDPAEQYAIDYAYSKGCIVVAAAGNQGAPGDPNCGGLSYPASDNHVISVGAVNSANKASYFSQHNNMVDVCAPGENVLVAVANGTNTYAPVNGTSFSSPYVASVAALAKSVDKSITEDYFEKLIKDTCTDLGAASLDTYYGWGLINAQKVVQASLNPIVLGVQNKGVYNTAQTIKFNKGTATLNGVPFSSGTTVSTSGSYTLIVTDSSNNSTTVNFSIDTTPLVLNGITDGSSYNTDKAIVFNYGTATLNGNQINSGYVVSAEGKYTVVLTSPFGSTSTYNFTVDKTAPTVTGVENGKSYTGNVTIQFNEGKALLNGNQIISGYVLNANGSYHLVVTDAAGNSSTLDFTIENNSASTTKINLSTPITQWVFDNASSYLCAITNSKSLLFINSVTLNVDKTLTLSAQPTDIIADSGKLYITLDDLKEIIVVDIATKAIINTITTVVDPYRLVKDGNNIYYVQGDQWCEVHNYNLSSNTDTRLTLGSLYCPDLAINPKDHILYIGESGLSGSKLYYYNTINNSIIGHTTYDNDYGYPYPQRVTLCDGNYIFYAGRAFDLTNPKHIEGDYNGGQTIVFAKNGLVFTNAGIYDEQTHKKLGSFQNQADLIEASDSGSLFVYNASNISLTKYGNNEGSLNQSTIIQQVGGTYAPSIPVSSSGIKTDSNITTLNIGSAITNWVKDNDTNTLCAISKNDKALYFINDKTLNVDKTLFFASGPTDIKLANNKLYISLDDANQILIIDPSTKTVISKIYTKYDPYSIAVDGDKIYYAENDQWCSINQYDLTTNNEICLLSSLCEPDIAIDPVTHILYIGEANLSGSDLTYYNTINNSIIGHTTYNNDYGYPYPQRVTLCDGKYVFYAGRAFDPANPLHIEGDYNGEQTIILAKYGMVFTSSSIYDEETHVKLGNLKNSVDLVEMSNAGDLFTFSYNSNSIVKYTSEDGTVNETKIVDQVKGTKSPQIPSTVTSTQRSPYEKSLSMTSDLNKWVNDDQSKILYAISKKDKAIFFINDTTLNIDKTIPLKSGPTDIICDNDKLYVALDDADQILEIDKISGNILNTFYTSSDPNKIVKDGNYLYYAERDQWCDIYSYNINTKNEKKLNISLVYYPGLALNTDNHILYIGESGGGGNKLYYYDLINDRVIGSIPSTSYVSNNIIYDGNYVFYSGNVYNPNSPSVVNSMGSITIFAKNGFIFTNNSAYDESDFSLVGTFPNSYDLVELSKNNDLFSYDKVNQQILREVGDTTPPVVTGVSDGCGYLGSVTITFDKGTALLDGVSFNNGDTVSEVGEHDLIVTDDDGNTTKVTFTIYSPLPDDDTTVTFKDDNLKSALINAGVDTNQDNIITRGEMRVLTQSLSLSSSNITDVTGMEYAVNLVDFDLSDNNIADASPLSKLTTLQSLNLWKNKLTDVSQLSGLKNLRALYLDENNINNLSVFANLTNLTDLSLGQNNITDISLLPDLQNLSTLYLNDNKISNINRLSHYTNLTTLDLSNNQITDISPLRGLINIGLNDGWLSLSGNNISSVSALSGFVNLKSMNLSKNNITDITPLGNLTNLCDLNLSDNQIVSISDLSNLKALGLNFGELNLAHNKITDISSLEGLSNIMFLDISGNKITNLSKINNLTNLLILNLSDCGLQNLAGIEKLSNLLDLDVSKNNISNIDELKNLTNLLGLDISNNEITDISPIKNLMLMNLDVSNNYLDISANSPTMNILNNFVSEYGSTIIYSPQKDLSQDPAPVISIGDYIKTPTNQNITVTASADKGTLNAQSHTFIQNGSFDFVATDNLGKKTTVTVTITNIDKTPPIITINPYNTAPTSSSVTVTASTNEGTINAASHTFTENGSFSFVATDAAGNVTTKTVTITNIGKADQVTGVSLDTTSANLKRGESTNLAVTVKPTEALNKSVTWSSSNTSVAIVDNAGKVSAIGKGTATITAKTIEGGYTANCIVNVANRDIQVNSLIGSSRYDTAVKLSQSQFSNSDNIIIVNGKAMADGLGATPLAKYINAPLLLTETKSLPGSTVNEIKRLKAKNAIIVGGTGVVSDDVKNEIQALGLTVTRISGSDRYGTSLEVAKYIDKNCYNVSKIVVSNGYGEADALSISSVAGRDNMPIILVEKDNIPTTTYNWLKSKNIENAYIIGGSGVVSNNVLNKLDEITSGDIRNNRLGGQDRFETNALVIDKFYGSGIDKTYIAKGYELVDALAAGPVAAINGSPVVLSGNDLALSQKTVLGKRYGNTIIRTGGGISDNSVNSLVQCIH
ncbi:S8 family serine peptidase [Candidatus Clostridium stratigraminis]|uniref:S8 family serine peptidase n=1 Tax=Candidatus Clostridium stratigraminis TaxID=3381661 RepID=A0ABW8T3A3_9CLOT